MAPPHITNSAQWPDLPESHPLLAFHKKLPGILSESEHSEIWQITLDVASPPPFTTYLVLQKFLRANAGNIEKAAEQLLATLKWRKQFKPLDALKEEFSAERFNGLGYVSKLKTLSGDTKVVTWNIYGAVKDLKMTFGEVDSFLRWRVALMELGIEQLHLKDATEPIPDYDARGDTVDPYQMIQVHDYKNISMLRMDPHVKACSKATIDTFREYYPELLVDKYFTNTPWIFAMIFNGFKAIIPAQTFKKFHVVANGGDLNRWISEDVPAIYGGKGPSLEEGSATVRLSGQQTRQTLTVPNDTAPLKSPATESFVSAVDRHAPETENTIPRRPVSTIALEGSTIKKVNEGSEVKDAKPAAEEQKPVEKEAVGETAPEVVVVKEVAGQPELEKPSAAAEHSQPATAHDPEKSVDAAVEKPTTAAPVQA